MQEGTDSKGTTVTAHYPHIVTVGDTTVRLRFSDSGSLGTHLANAFSAMLE